MLKYIPHRSLRNIETVRKGGHGQRLSGFGALAQLLELVGYGKALQLGKGYKVLVNHERDQMLIRFLQSVAFAPCKVAFSKVYLKTVYQVFAVIFHICRVGRAYR
jgi:hypothetical protein